MTLDHSMTRKLQYTGLFTIIKSKFQFKLQIIYTCTYRNIWPSKWHLYISNSPLVTLNLYGKLFFSRASKVNWENVKQMQNYTDTRGATISQLTNNLIERKSIANYFDNRLIISYIFKAKMSNICCSQLLKYKNLLLICIIYDSKWRVFRFSTVGWTKEAFWKICNEYFSQFLDILMTIWLIN